MKQFPAWDEGIPTMAASCLNSAAARLQPGTVRGRGGEYDDPGRPDGVPGPRLKLETEGR